MDETSAKSTDGITGFARILRATRVGFNALHWGLKSEEALRIELFALIPLVPLAIWLGHDGVERALLVGSLLLIVITELLNTAVEVVVDRIGTERNELSGLAKDLGSAAVMFSLFYGAVVWGFILLDRS